jgi:hypothetical protein
MPIGQRPEAGYLPISASGRLFCAAVMATTVMVAWLPGGRGWRRCGGRGRSRDAPAAEPARGLPRLLRGGVPRRGRPVRGPGRFAGAGSEAWTQAAAYCRGRRAHRSGGHGRWCDRSRRPAHPFGRSPGDRGACRAGACRSVRGSVRACNEGAHRACEDPTCRPPESAATWACAQRACRGGARAGAPDSDAPGCAGACSNGRCERSPGRPCHARGEHRAEHARRAGRIGTAGAERVRVRALR